jgi:hypothetical protein
MRNFSDAQVTDGKTFTLDGEEYQYLSLKNIGSKIKSTVKKVAKKVNPQSIQKTGEITQNVGSILDVIKGKKTEQQPTPEVPDTGTPKNVNKSKTTLYVGIGAGALVLVGIIYFATKKSSQ